MGQRNINNYCLLSAYFLYYIVAEKSPLPVNLKLIFAFLLFSTAAQSQNQLPVIKSRAGNIGNEKAFVGDIDPFANLNSNNFHKGNLYLLLQFKAIPSVESQRNLMSHGIELLEYIPDNTYIAKIDRVVPASVLKQLNIVNTVSIPTRFKVEPALNPSIVQPPAITEKSVEVLVGAYPRISVYELIQELDRKKIQAIPYKKGVEGVVKCSIPISRVNEIASLPFVYYVEEFSGEEREFNNESNVLHSTSFLQSVVPGIGRGLTGQGVVLGMGDIGGAGHHIDHYYKTIEPWPSAVNHSTHVAGIMAGSGIVDPRMKGRAPKSTLVVESLTDIYTLAPGYFKSIGLVLTNNSYGSASAVCRNFGIYNLASRLVDQMGLDYPEITNVFAAGNEVSSNCAPFPSGYYNVFGGPQAAKNAITVGGGSKDDATNFYSKGPTADGRIKPEITATGREVYSTVPGNTYYANFGTSMATPQVTGSLALLIERYRQLNNGANPPSALLKNLICNSTVDAGNTGPDFANGFGVLDALPAVEMLEKKNYFSANVQHGAQQTNTFSIGTNATEVKIMLNWYDRPASLFAQTTLVNDLDITVTSPNGTVYKPLVPSSASVLTAAVSNEDHENNMEQIIIRNPVPGNYTVVVKGYRVPFGPQPYFITYNITEKGFRLIAPVKTDKWKSGETQFVKWEEAGENPVSYSIEYSETGGSSWTSLGTTPGNKKYFRFTVPSTFTTNARIRVTNTVSGNNVVVDSISVLPELSFDLKAGCQKMVEMYWRPVAGIDSFAIWSIVNGDMKVIATTTDTFYLHRNLHYDSAYWYALSPYKNGMMGERSIAKTMQPIEDYKCTLGEFDGDIGIDRVITPASGRKFTSTERSAAENIYIYIVNHDDVPTNEPYILTARVNGQLHARDTIVNVIQPMYTLLYTMGKKLDLSVPGSYHIELVLEKAGDHYSGNDTARVLVRIADNKPLVLPYVDNFNQAKDTIYSYPGYIGIDGAENWDFETNNFTGILKTTFSPTNKALIVSKLKMRPLNVTSLVTATYNLSNYTTADNIFIVINPGFFRPGLTSIRGSDTSAWISASVPNPINITSLLLANNQKYSSSFQLRISIDRSNVLNTPPDTITYFDNIQLYTVGDDPSAHLFRLDAARYVSKDTALVTATIVNNLNKPLTNVVYTIRNFSNLLTDSIASMKGYDTVTRTYKVYLGQVNRSMIDTFVLKINRPTDSYPDNNERRFLIQLTPLVDSFPYREGFETNNIWTSTTPYFQTENNWPNKYINTAANGQKFWYTSNVADDYPDVRGLSVTSPAFDLTKTRNAYLSFSTARNIRTGRDSAYLQISYNKGATWVKLNSTINSNWYNARNKSVWSDSDKVYWHSVTTKLPDTNRVIMLRWVTTKTDSFKLPIWLGAMAFDDVHIYSTDKTIADSIRQITAGTFAASGSQWKEMIVNGKIAGAVNFREQSGFNLNWQLIPSPDTISILNGNKLFRNRWVLKSDQANSAFVSVRLFFTDAEAEQLRRSNKCVGCIDTTTAYRFAIYSYRGSNSSINAKRSDNAASRYYFASYSTFDLVPYTNGYYAELEVPVNGEFYIALPERFSNPVTEFAARPGENNSAAISWRLSGETGIEKFQLEKALGDEGFDNEQYTTLNSQNAGSILNYTYEDKAIDPNQKNYYRLKIIYKNGYVQYTPEQLVTIRGNSPIVVYPNPSNGLYTVSIPQTNGNDLFMQVSNELGQVLLTIKREPTGNLDEVKLDLRKSIYPSGIYFLKVNNGREVKTFKLVKQ